MDNRNQGIRFSCSHRVGKLECGSKITGLSEPLILKENDPDGNFYHHSRNVGSGNSSMTDYYPTITIHKQGRQIKVDWSTWDGYGGRVKSAQLYSGSAYTDQTTNANNDVRNDLTLMGSSPAVNDAYYIGHYIDLERFLSMYLG